MVLTQSRDAIYKTDANNAALEFPMAGVTILAVASLV